MSKLFGRNYKLTLLSDNDELVYQPPMQIRFACIVRQGNSGGSTAEVTIYGISREARQRLFKTFDRLQLSAGYGDRAGLIFSGGIINLEMGREGTDQYIKFYARPTAKPQSQAFISKSWGEGASQLEIIRDIAATLLLPVEFIGDFGDLAGAIKGRTILQSSVEAMNELGKLHGFSWVLGANRLIIIRTQDGAMRDRRQGEAHIISAENGMVGSPQILIPGVEVTKKLDPSIVPGDEVDIRADTRNFAFSGVYQRAYADPSGGNGLYGVIEVRHEGDFYGDTWNTSITGRRES